MVPTDLGAQIHVPVMIRAESAESHGWNRQKQSRAAPQSKGEIHGWKRTGSSEARLDAAPLEEKAADPLNGRPGPGEFQAVGEIAASETADCRRRSGLRLTPEAPASACNVPFAQVLRVTSLASAGTVYQIDSLRPPLGRLILPWPTVCDFSTGVSDERVCITAAYCAMSSRHGRRCGAGCAVTRFARDGDEYAQVDFPALRRNDRRCPRGPDRGAD